MKSGDVRFVRIRGRVVPIRNKKAVVPIQVNVKAQGDSTSLPTKIGVGVIVGLASAAGAYFGRGAIRRVAKGAGRAVARTTGIEAPMGPKTAYEAVRRYGGVFINKAGKASTFKGPGAP